MGAIVSNVGTWMQRVAQDWLILVLTGSGLALGITTALQLLPALLLSPIAGVVADRYPKRVVLQVTQVAMLIPAAILGTLAVTGAVEAWNVYLLAFIFGIATAFDAPARQSFVVEMVGRDDLANAVGLNSASFNSARMIGPASAGLLIAAFGSGANAAGWVILINAVSYLAVLASLRRINPALLQPAPASTTRHGAIAEGLRYLRTRPDLVLVLLAVFCVGTFGMNFQMTSALMATEVFGRGAGGFGLLASIMAIGSLGGALLAARRANPRLRYVVIAGVAFGTIQVVSSWMPTYWSFAAVLPLLGLAALTMITSANALIQITSIPEMRGRMAALYLMIFMGGTPFGAPLIGSLAEFYGPRIALSVSGVVCIVGICLAALWFVRHERKSRRGVQTMDPGTEIAEIQSELIITSSENSVTK